MSTARKNKHLTLHRGGHQGVSAEIHPDSKFQAIFEQASDAIITVNPDGTIDEVNQAFEELIGYLRTQSAGKNISMISPDPKHHRIPARTRAFEPSILQHEGFFEDIAVVRSDGYVRLVDLNVRHVKSGKSRLAVLLFRDVTAKKQMERELITKQAEMKNAYFKLERANAELKSTQSTLIQAGKMAALGELTAGIAHEINQPLMAIRGYSQEVQALIPDGKAQTHLNEIISSVDKISKIITHLRNFATQSTEDYEWIDVHTSIEEALKLLSRQFTLRGIKVERDYADDLPKTFVNPIQIEQVFINLSTNARDAIEATRRGQGTIRIQTRKKSKFIEVEFADDGCGMNERTQAKIFNPFFTTKEVGQGMGLGMSLSYGILSRIHGTILVESKLGQGSKFLIRIPIDFRELG